MVIDLDDENSKSLRKPKWNRRSHLLVGARLKMSRWRRGRKENSSARQMYFFTHFIVMCWFSLFCLDNFGHHRSPYEADDEDWHPNQCFRIALSTIGIHAPLPQPSSYWCQKDGNPMIEAFGQELVAVQTLDAGATGKFIVHWGESFYGLTTL